MRDLTDRLRNPTWTFPPGSNVSEVATEFAVPAMRDAADHIEHLEATLAKMREVLPDLATEIANLQARARFGPGLDMGGKHNPLPSEVQEAKMLVEWLLAILGREDDQ